MTLHDRLMTVEERWSKERLKDVGKIWNFKEEQKAGMQELQHRLSDIDHWKNDPYEVVRWFNEFHGDVAKTERLFRYTIQWRLEQDVDSHLERYGDPHPMFHYYPIGILEGTDKQGDAIYLDRMGAADSYALVKEFGINGVVDYMIFFYEYISRREFWQQFERRTGRRVTNFSVIIDLEGLNAGHMRPGLLPLLQKVARVTQDCYAGWGKKIYLVRAPAIFKYIWAIARIFFDQHIRDMITLASQSDYLEVLGQSMDLEVLPPCVAPGYGKGKSMPGYFEDIIWEGGPIPSRMEAEKQANGRKNKTLARRASTDSTSTSLSFSRHTLIPAAVNATATRLLLKGFWDEPSMDDSNDSTMTTVSVFPVSHNFATF